MKLVFLIGDSAVGKMTVGQELMKRTGLRLFHNHMTIELVLEIFGEYDGSVISKLREVVFQEFAVSDNEGLIFTYMWAFDQQSDWNYVEHVSDIFRRQGADIYYVELVAAQEIRLQRNRSENRLKNKVSKRDIQVSEERLLQADEKHRLISEENEIPYDNYLKIDTSDLSAEKTAEKIRRYFQL